MKFNLKTTNLEPIPELNNYLKEKMNGLDRFIEHVDSVVQAWVEVGRTSLHHQTGRVYRAEVQIHLPGKSVRAEAIAENIFTAFNEVLDELQRELKKYKGKQAEKQEKGSRRFKRILKGTW